MCIVEVQFNLKPGVDADEIPNLFGDLAVPIYRKIPGCVSANICRYEPISDSGVPEYEYVLIEVWESKEANLKALSDRYIGLGDSELKRTGFYDRLGAMITGIGIAVRALPLAPTK